MSQGKAVAMCQGKRVPQRVYIKLKNGAVYCHPTLFNQEGQIKLAQSIKENGCKVRLKHWIPIRSSSGDLLV